MGPMFRLAGVADAPGPRWRRFCYHRAVPGRSVSRREVFKYALSPALLSLGTLAVTSGSPMASAASTQLIDFAERRISPDEIKAAGYAGVINYVSEERPGAHFEAKPLTRDYADALRAAGLHIVSNFQYGKPGWAATPSDFTRGHDGGVADAQTALRLHNAAGGTGSAPIFFSVDDNIDVATWNSLAVEWFRGINSVLGVERTGIYGHANACGWAVKDGVIGHSTSPGFRWGWQTKAWSNGEREPTAVLYQGILEGPVLNGIKVDVDDVLAPDYGQWDLDR